MNYLLEITGLEKSYHDGEHTNVVLKNINLKVREGEFIAIVGYSGAGKTTLISMLAGLEKPTAGGVIFQDKEVTGPGPDRGVVFQNYSLLPWLSVEANVSLSVNAVCPTLNAAERKERALHYIDMVGLSHAINRRPAELSGGMRQRVSVARALAMKPEVLLMDEPLSALDALSRARLQDEFADISRKEKSTIVLVTNDVDEALLLADRVLTLTPAPAATLGREFNVDIPRPRHRTDLNHNEQFISLRSEITRYLLSLNKFGQAKESSVEQKNLPNVVPISLTKRNRRKKKPPETIAQESVTAGRSRYLQFSDTSKTYPTPEGPLTVVDGFALSMDKGDFISLIGHSGCGKSTVLSMAAGLNPISDGAIILDGQHISTAGPDRAVVFQSPSLMPWLTAFENVSLGVDRIYPKASDAERRDIVEYYLERVGLADSMYRIAANISNGMKQRVGIARAFALSPKLLLLDEPFGMLDSLTRWELQDVLMDVWAQTKVTTVCVTHDVDEAILLADRVVMMSNGPRARVGNIMNVDLPRPRSRDNLLSHPDYYAYREELLDFLEAYEGGANPDQSVLESIAAKREKRINRENTVRDKNSALALEMVD